MDGQEVSTNSYDQTRLARSVAAAILDGFLQGNEARTLKTLWCLLTNKSDNLTPQLITSELSTLLGSIMEAVDAHCCVFALMARVDEVPVPGGRGAKTLADCLAQHMFFFREKTFEVLRPRASAVEIESGAIIPRKKAYLNKGWSVLEKMATEVSLKILRSELTVESPRQAVLVDTPSEAEESTVEEDPDALEIFQARTARSAAALKLLINDCGWTETIPESHDQ